MITVRIKRKGVIARGFVLVLSLGILLGCSQIKTPQPSPFYAESAPPRVQELRWSNGAKPKTLDPARVSSPSESDIVRALFEGLTAIDPRTLTEIPAAAESWAHDKSFRTWTFQIRDNARWSNGRDLTAQDFIASWRRVYTLGERAPNRSLIRNIVGLAESDAEITAVDFESSGTEPASEAEAATPPDKDVEQQSREPAKKGIGLEAQGEKTLIVRLESPDKDFAKLVANVVFRPVYENGRNTDFKPGVANLVTNGPFVLAPASANGINLRRSEQYWNSRNVSLERVRFLSFDSADSALTAYKNGDIDAVTNVEFEPLALKLLEPFRDFRRTTYGAVNFYELNTTDPPFNDRRVREALAISIDRDRLASGELEGATRPAATFLPMGRGSKSSLAYDETRAKELFESAGYPNGENFPRVRLVVNRNETQQRVARTVARMWKQNLNIDTETLVKASADYNAARTTLDYDVIRRGVVIPTLDEAVSLESIFGRTARIASESDTVLATDGEAKPDNALADTSAPAEPAEQGSEDISTEVFSEDDALYELNAIPLYFPTSYSLVKPYVDGFEINGVDAPLLSAVRINNDWRRE